MSEIQYQNDGSDRIYRKLFVEEKQKYLLADEVGLGKTVTAANVIVKLAEKNMKQGKKGTRIVYVCSNMALANANINKLRDKITNQLNQAMVINESAARPSLIFLKVSDSSKKDEKHKIEIYAVSPSTTIKVTSKGTQDERACAYLLLWGPEDNRENDDWFETCCRMGNGKDSWETTIRKYKKKLNKLEEKHKQDVFSVFYSKFMAEWENIRDECITAFIETLLAEMPETSSGKTEDKLQEVKDFIDYSEVPKEILNVCCVERVYEDIKNGIKKRCEGIGNEPNGKKLYIGKRQIKIDNKNSLDEAFNDAFSKTCYQEMMRRARKCMIQMSVERLKADLFIADEIQNYSDIFRKDIKKDTDYGCVMDRIIHSEDKVLMMSATPFRYRSLMNSLENENKDPDVDQNEEFDAQINYLKNDSDIYEEFTNILEYLSPGFSEEDLKEWEKLNESNREYLISVGQSSDHTPIVEMAEKYKKNLQQQSELLTNANISRVERYASKLPYEIHSKEKTVPFDQIAIEEIKQLPYAMAVHRNDDEDEYSYDIQTEDDLVETNLRQDYIKSTPAFFSYSEGYKKLDQVFDSKDGHKLDKERIENFEPVFAGREDADSALIYNARICRLFEKLFDEEKQHMLLFIPPTSPKAELKGIYANTRGVSKRLFFSDYKMTPRSLSTLITYEAERRAAQDLKVKYSLGNEDGSEIKKVYLYKAEKDEQVPYICLNDLIKYDSKEKNSDEQRWNGIWNNDLSIDDVVDKLLEYDKNTSDQERPFRQGSIYDYAMNHRIEIPQREEDEFCKAYYKYMCKPSSLRVILAYADDKSCTSNSDPVYLFDKILEYGANGCIWDVMDEYAVYCKGNPLGFASEVKNVLSTRNNQLKVYTKNQPSQFGSCVWMDTDFATGHFSGDKISKESSASTLEHKITRFNSPFWPFLFISTSIGQEGFDFHVYCRKVVHWSLEYNPVKFEQREGRINRYQSYSNRLRLVEYMKQENLEFEDWQNAFDRVRDLKKEMVDKSKGLFPDFVVPDSNDERYGLERECYYYPYSYEQHKFDEVLRSVAYYRSLLGQTGNDTYEEDFQAFIDKLKAQNVEVDKGEYFVDLYPYENK